MSTHQNSTHSSATINTPTSTKPPTSPVKVGSKSKSRHSSASDSTCVTPTGSSSTGGGPHSNTTAGGPDDKNSIRVTRKIFNNWRSACGRTKDKTKDFIRRWKTLPENQSAECETGGDSEHHHHHHHHHTTTVSSSHGSSGATVPCAAGGGLNNMDQSAGGGVGGRDTATSGGATSASGSGGGGTGSGDISNITTTPLQASKQSGFGKIRSLTKKFSQDIPSEDHSTSSISQSKPSAGWSVHVWGKSIKKKK